MTERPLCNMCIFLSALLRSKNTEDTRRVSKGSLPTSLTLDDWGSVVGAVWGQVCCSEVHSFCQFPKTLCAPQDRTPVQTLVT